MIEKDLIAATPTIESKHPAVVDFATTCTEKCRSDIERSVALFYAVRDGFRYDPYQIELSVEGMKASKTLGKGHGWCVSKAVLLAATCRALQIPAKLGFADVRNHLSTERMRQRMRTDLFYWHGYTEIWLEGRWLKATPAFNIELCERFGLLPLDFDGRNDSLYHPFDASGNRHMEYVNLRGSYVDLPLEEIIQTFKEEYGFEANGEEADSSFESDVDQETEGRNQ